MTHTARISFFLIAALPNAIFAQAGLPMAKPESVGMSSKRLERIHAFIQDYIDTNQIAGAVTLVARKGKVVHFESQGWRYKEENQPMEKDALFSLASMTKPIVSSALMMLWEDGKFMLDDPISKWLPSYAKKDVVNPLTGVRSPAIGPITVRHVLTQTSGLSLTPPTPGGERPKTLLEAIERAASTPLAFQPGERENQILRRDSGPSGVWENNVVPEFERPTPCAQGGFRPSGKSSIFKCFCFMQLCKAR